MILRFWFVAMSFFLIDQATKLLTLKFFKFPLGQYNTPVIEDKLSIYPMYNENNILGFFELPIEANVYKFIYLVLALIVFYGCVWVVKHASKAANKFISFTLAWGLGLIAGSFAGNAIDRFLHYGVVDFIQVHDLYLVMNFADIFALIGAAMSFLVVSFIFANFKTYRHVKIF